MKDAQKHWGFLTTFDLSTIKYEVPLRTMVKDRPSISETQAQCDVREDARQTAARNTTTVVLMSGTRTRDAGFR